LFNGANFIACSDQAEGSKTPRRQPIVRHYKFGGNVRFGSKADICAARGHVRFTPNSDRKSGPPQNAMPVFMDIGAYP
jgi:hypothetical protein